MRTTSFLRTLPFSTPRFISRHPCRLMESYRLSGTKMSRRELKTRSKFERSRLQTKTLRPTRSKSESGPKSLSSRVSLLTSLSWQCRAFARLLRMETSFSFPFDRTRLLDSSSTYSYSRLATDPFNSIRPHPH